MFGAEASRLVVRLMDYDEIHAALADHLVRIAYGDSPAAVSASDVCAHCGDLDIGADGYRAQVVQLLANPERAMVFGHALLQRDHAQFLADPDDCAGRDYWRFARPFAAATCLVHTVFVGGDVSPDEGGAGPDDICSPTCLASVSPMRPLQGGGGQVWTCWHGDHLATRLSTLCLAFSSRAAWRAASLGK